MEIGELELFEYWKQSMANPIFDISSRNLNGKTLLEVGSGRGDTTRFLAKMVEREPGARLIVSDLSDAHFASLGEELKGINIRFIRTDARQLNGIGENSIDYLVCHYTLCAVEAEAGGALQALARFHEVVKPGGELFIEEEFPIELAKTPRQGGWAEKWQILKSALLIAGEKHFHEFTPENLKELCFAAGFTGVEWQSDASLLSGMDVLSFFHIRLERMVKHFPNAALQTGFREWATALVEKMKVTGGMEIPFYRLHAYKEKST